MNFLQVSETVRDKAGAVRFLQQRGLLHQQRMCNNGHHMTLSLSDREDRWRCRRRACNEQKQLKADTWFHGSHLSYRDATLFIYCWSQELTSIKFCERELNISPATVVDYNNYLREVCAHHLLTNPRRIGGPNTTVEIDESQFVRRKNNVGRLVRPQWVFGGICRETKECFLYAVENRTAATLQAVIQDLIVPGTTIVSDMWRAYEGIDRMGYQHMTVNHSQNFVDPVTGAHTNSVEGLWSRAKAKNRRRHGIHRHLLDSYMCEFMWRQRVRNRDAFHEILTHIRDFNPLV